MSKYWEIDEIRPARIHANVPEGIAEHFEGFGGSDVRDEGQRPQVDRRLGCCRLTSANTPRTHPLAAARPL